MTPPAARFDAGAVRKAGQTILEDRITSRQKPSHELLRPGDVGRAMIISQAAHTVPVHADQATTEFRNTTPSKTRPFPDMTATGSRLLSGATKSSAALSLVHCCQWVPTALRMNTSIGLMAMA